jgi:hypothetical protein
MLLCFCCRTHPFFSHEVNPQTEVNCVRVDDTVFPAQIAVKVLTNFQSSIIRQKQYRDDHFPENETPLVRIDSLLMRRMIQSHCLKFLMLSVTTAGDMFLVMFQDLTSTREARSAIVEAERERQANEAKSRFLGLHNLTIT